MECKTDFKQSFQPVTFTLTCQTPEDLVALWQRFNLPVGVAKEYGERRGPLSHRGSRCQETWEEVDNVVHQLGWR